jgi:glycine cleavage system H protein
MEYPEDLKYSDSHEYARLDGEIATIGITSFAIKELGDIVFLQLLIKVKDSLKVGEVIGNIESVKAVAELYAPVSGTVIEVNQDLIDNPESISEDLYGEGWLFKVKLDNPDEDLSKLLSVSEYADLVGENH